jgi:hypothetical protein
MGSQEYDRALLLLRQLESELTEARAIGNLKRIESTEDKIRLVKEKLGNKQMLSKYNVRTTSAIRTSFKPENISRGIKKMSSKIQGDK